MRTSSFYFRWAYVIWTIATVATFSIFFVFNGFINLPQPLPFFLPLVGSVIFRLGSKVAIKGARLRAIEEGKLSEYLKVVNSVQRKPKVWSYILTIFLVIAIILIVINLLKG
jgi:hypothetical protein